MTSSPPPQGSAADGPRRRWRAPVLALVALAAGAATGTLPFVLVVVIVVAVIRWAQVAGSSSVSRILTAAEVQMAPALEAYGFAEVPEGSGPRPPEGAIASVLPAGTRQVRQRHVPRADLRPLEVATAEVAGGLLGMRRRAVITVAHELDDPADEAAAAALLQASTLVPTGGEVPETTRFACREGWVVAGFDPLRSRDPGSVVGALTIALGRIVQDARTR